MKRNDTLNEICLMLESMDMPYMMERLKNLYGTPEMGEMDTINVIKDIVASEYASRSNTKYKRYVSLSGLSRMKGNIEDLYTHNGRVYNDNVLKQLKTMRFIDNGHNFSIFGQSDAGKSYALVSIGLEACRQGYRTVYYGFVGLLDRLAIWHSKGDDYFKSHIDRIKKTPLLLIDDFMTCSDKERFKHFVDLFELIKWRTDNGYPTGTASQYAPEEWDKMVDSNFGMMGELDAIRRRLVKDALVITISLENKN